MSKERTPKGLLIQFPNLQDNTKTFRPMSLRIPQDQLPILPQKLVGEILSSVHGNELVYLGYVLDASIIVNTHPKHLTIAKSNNALSTDILTLYTDKELNRYKGRPVRLLKLEINQKKYPGIAKTLYYYKKGLFYLVSIIQHIISEEQCIFRDHLSNIITHISSKDTKDMEDRFIQAALNEKDPTLTYAPFLFKKTDLGACLFKNSLFMEEYPKILNETEILTKKLESLTAPDQKQIDVAINNNHRQVQPPSEKQVSINDRQAMEYSPPNNNTSQPTPNTEAEDLNPSISGLKPGVYVGF